LTAVNEVDELEPVDGELVVLTLTVDGDVLHLAAADGEVAAFPSGHPTVKSLTAAGFRAVTAADFDSDDDDDLDL
jgi:hypothetical protein